jgi:hypothetical protein
MSEHLLMRFLIDAFEGFIISLPLNFLNVHPRKSKPWSMCVMDVFSADSASPLGWRNSLTNVFSSSAVSFEFAVITK